MPGTTNTVRLFVSGTTTNPLSGETGWAKDVQLPFGFRFFEQGPFTKFNVGAKGYITFVGAGSSNDWDPNRSGADYILRTAAPKNVIAAWWGDHFCTPDTGVKTKVLGEAPNRQFVIEWDGCSKRAPTGAASKTIFQTQVWLYEGSDAFRVRYGTVDFGSEDWESGTPPNTTPLPLSWGVKGNGPVGFMGPGRDGAPVCKPQLMNGTDPACTGRAHFPRNTTIQYGRSSFADVSGRVKSSDLVVSPTTFDLDVAVDLLNAGEAPANGVNFDVYLATAWGIEPGAAGSFKVASSTVPRNLTGGELRPVIQSVRNATRPPNGRYYVCAFFDPANSLAERDRSNNWVCSHDTILLGPDLVGTITAPVEGSPGATVNVPITIQNLGTDASGAFNYEIAIKPVENPGGVPPREIVLVARAVDGVQAGGTLQKTESVRLPDIVRAERYFFELKLDGDLEVPESDRSNNTSQSSGSMFNNRPALQISAGFRETLPDGCFYGEAIEATFEVCNAGRAVARNFKPGLIMGDGTIPHLGSDVTAASSPQFCGSPGTWNYTACEPVAGRGAVCAFEYCHAECNTNADCGSTGMICGDNPDLSDFLGRSAKSCMNELRFGTEPRNLRCRTFAVKGKIPMVDQNGIPYDSGTQRFHFIDDATHSLSMLEPTHQPSKEYECHPARLDLATADMRPTTKLVAGKEVPIRRLIQNLGFTNLVPGAFVRPETETFEYRYYLATTPDISVHQIPLQITSTSSGAGTATVTRKGSNQLTDLVSIPAELVPGEYYLGIILDPENKLVEHDKRNNVYVYPQKVRVEGRGLEVVTATLPRANVGTQYSYAFVATGGTGPYVWSVENPPPGMTMKENGSLQGVVTDVGTFAFTVRVTSGDAIHERVVALQVLPGQSELEVATKVLPIAVKGSPYGRWFDSVAGRYEQGVRLAASGGIPPYRWEIDPFAEASRMPEGIQDPTPEGLILGQATLMSESSRFLVRVSDSLGNENSAWLEIVVVEAGTLVLPSRPFPLAESGSDYEGCIVAEGGDGTFVWDVNEGLLPPGLTSEGRDFKICLVGRPTACGDYTVDVRVGDGQGQSTSASVSLSVECGPIQLNSRSVRPVSRGEEVEFQLLASPNRSPTFRIYRGSLPSGLTLSANGLISGTVAEDAAFDSHDLIIELSDVEGRRSLSALTMSVVVPERLRKINTTKKEGGCASTGGSTGALSTLGLALFGAAVLRRRSAGGPADSRSRWVAFSGLIALLAVGAVACGEDTVTQPESFCADIECGPNFTCDEADGLCKCGETNGVICREDEACVLDPTPQCVSSLCEFVTCERGQSCDAESGACKCGDTTCGEEEFCVRDACTTQDPCADVICGDGTQCVDGQCMCGETICVEGATCVEGSCVVDRCAGVSCGVNSVCNPEDGSCHCGGTTGSVCTTGEACLDDGDGGFACQVSTLCDGVVCGGGTVCDPEDGECRCGGVGTSHRVCLEGQSCVGGECRGGNLCAPGGVPTVCGAGLDCDPTDGICKCGGSDGTVCGENEGCSVLAGKKTCTSFCKLLAISTGCSTGEGCYYDSKQVHGKAFCAPAGTRGLDDECEEPNDCGPDYHCNLASKCTLVCDVTVGPGFCTTAGATHQCVPFTFGEIYGYCRAP